MAIRAAEHRVLAYVFTLVFVLGTLMVPIVSRGQTQATPSSSANDPVIMAAGDIACGATTPSNSPCHEQQTAALVLAKQPDAVLAIGDTQYECGELEDFQHWFDPSWGQFKSLIRPAIGNHEYQVSDGDDSPCPDAARGGAGYWNYFGDASTPLQPGCRVDCKGYYSFDVGTWHLVALNSNCSRVGGCDPGSPQYEWLRADLAAHPNACTLVYQHHSRFSSGRHGSFDQYVPLWQVMAAAGVDVFLAGHDHDYERFAPQTPDGIADDDYGIRTFVVGTGGKNLTGLSPETGRLPGSEVFQDTTFGVLQMTLHPDGYDWKFVSAEGSEPFEDAGTSACHSAPPGAAVGTPIGTPVDPATPATLASPIAASVLFADDFESGDLKRWNSVNGLTVTTGGPEGGLYVARASGTGNSAYARTALAAPTENLIVKLRFKIVAKDDNALNLIKLRSSDDTALFGIFLSNHGKLANRNDVADNSAVSELTVEPDVWHELDLRLQIVDGIAQVAVEFDGSLVAGLSGPVTLGSSAIGGIQLGENQNGRTFDILFDDVSVEGIALSTGTPEASPIPAASPAG